MAVQGVLEAMRLLVQYGADVNRRTQAKRSAISGSILTLGLDQVSFLLDQGAKPNVADGFGVSFPYLLSEQIADLQTAKDPRLPQARAIRDRIIRMGVKWPPETPEQLREWVWAEYRQKTGKDYIFKPEPGNRAFLPVYVPVPVRKTPLRRDLPYEEAVQLHRRQDTAGGSDPKARR